MKVPRHVVEGRRRRLADLLARHRYLPVQELCNELGVSEATVRRDLVWLEENQLVTRTYGGALAEFNQRFPSFRQRMTVGADLKQRLGRQVHGLLRPGMTVFFDGGTTVYAVAEALRREPVTPLTGVTINLPVADLLAEVDGIAMDLTGGLLLRRQSVLGGPGAIHGASRWQFDLALCSAQGMTREGIWNSDAEIVALQRAVAERSARVVFLLDAEKLGRTTPHFLLPWEEIDGLVTDASAAALTAHGISPKLTEVAHNLPPFAVQTLPKPSTVPAPGESKTGLTLPTELL